MSTPNPKKRKLERSEQDSVIVLDRTVSIKTKRRDLKTKKFESKTLKPGQMKQLIENAKEAESITQKDPKEMLKETLSKLYNLQLELISEKKRYIDGTKKSFRHERLKTALNPPDREASKDGLCDVCHADMSGIFSMFYASNPNKCNGCSRVLCKNCSTKCDLCTNCLYILHDSIYNNSNA